jgi:hypothetical protein
MIHELRIEKDFNGRGHNLNELLYWNVVVILRKTTETCLGSSNPTKIQIRHIQNLNLNLLPIGVGSAEKYELLITVRFIYTILCWTFMFYCFASRNVTSA